MQKMKFTYTPSDLLCLVHMTIYWLYFRLLQNSISTIYKVYCHLLVLIIPEVNVITKDVCYGIFILLHGIICIVINVFIFIVLKWWCLLFLLLLPFSNKVLFVDFYIYVILSNLHGSVKISKEEVEAVERSILAKHAYALCMLFYPCWGYLQHGYGAIIIRSCILHHLRQALQSTQKTTLSANILLALVLEIGNLLIVDFSLNSSSLVLHLSNAIDARYKLFPRDLCLVDEFSLIGDVSTLYISVLRPLLAFHQLFYVLMLLLLAPIIRDRRWRWSVLLLTSSLYKVHWLLTLLLHCWRSSKVQRARIMCKYGVGYVVVPIITTVFDLIHTIIFCIDSLEFFLS